VNKLYIACAILVPIIGCTGIAGDDPTMVEGGGSGVQAAGNTSAAGANSSSGASSTGNAGSTAIAGWSSNGGSTGNAGSSASAAAGAGGLDAMGGTSASGGTANGGNCSVEALPAALQTLLTNKCASCHGATPLPTLPSLVSYANLVAPSKSDPGKTYAVVALARLQSTTMPMPPAPGTPASASDIATLQDFISKGYPKPSCPSGGGGAGGGGGGGSAGAPSLDPLNAQPTCTSMTSWSNGNRGSASMNPGMACISCHKSGEGPSFSIAGTVYPTGHEPDRCNSSVGTAGARIVIIGADGKMTTLTPNAVGNFSSNATIKTPYQAKVTYQGRERIMTTPQSSGDCNSCHSQNGSMLAPGRITVP
jgi:hypothetical protein